MIRIADIQEGLRAATESAVWQRGRRYYADGAVKTLSFSADPRYPLCTVSAQVRGTELYQTRITFNVDEDEVTEAVCDCPFAQDHEYCKHIAALGLALCARMRAVLGDGRITLEAGEMAAALTSGKPPRKNGTGAPRADDAAAFISPPALAGISRFKRRYALILNCAYERPQAYLCDTKESRRSPGSDMPDLSRSALRFLLSDTSFALTAQEHALVEYLSKHDAWSRETDLHRILSLAYEAKIPIYRDEFGTTHRMNMIDDGEKLPVPLTLKLVTYEPPPGFPDARSRAYFECSMDMRKSHVWITGTAGFVSIRKHEIRLLAAQPVTCTLIKRMREMGAYGDSKLFSGKLTGAETIHINEILADLARCFPLETALTPEYTVTQYDTAAPILIVDFHAADSKLSIRGGIDYGCEILDLAEEWRNTGWTGSTQFRRRVDPITYPFIVSIDGMKIGYADVDEKKERAAYCAINQQYGFNKHSSLTISGTRKIERFLENDWGDILKLGWKIVFTRDTIRYSAGDVRTDIAADLDAARDWLAFDVTLYCGEERVRLQDVVDFIERGDECLKTADGRLIRVTNRPDLERLVRMLERFSKNEKTGAYEGKLYNAPEVADIASNSPHYRMQLAKSFKSFAEEAQSGKPVKKVKLPSAHQELLRPYQVRGVEWMHFLRSYRFGGILADEMGLGKTIQALSHISIHKKDGESSLVIAPKTLLHNWAREAHERFPDLIVAVIEGAAAERRSLILEKPSGNAPTPHLYITSYPLAQRDVEHYKARTKPFQYLLLDEAQSIKNPRTKNAHAVKAIPAEYRIALTGTPLENSVEELWSVFDFLMPGFLGAHASFQKHFGRPIMEHGDARALAHLKSKTSAFMLRRTKAEVLKELPAKIETSLAIELNDDQNILYQEVLARTKTELFAQVAERGFKRSQIHILAALTKLRQICNHPSLVEPRGAYSSAKLDACMEIVHEIRSERRKVLIFSQFTGMLDIIEKRLKDEKVAFCMLTGKTVRRQELVDAFNADPSITVFLISLKAGGTGLNLTSADTVIVFDPWWNPAVENQAIDRTHRIGQKKTVNVYRLVTQGTIEEKILSLQGKKRALFDALVQENADLFKKLTWDDVQSLFRR